MTTHLIRMYEDGQITGYQLMIDCLHMIDPLHPELVLNGLPEEIYDELLTYAARYDPYGKAPKERIMPVIDQVEAASNWIKQRRSSQQ